MDSNTQRRYKYDIQFKYIVIGDSGVGKSCVLLQFTEKKFQSTHEYTIGVEFGSRVIYIEDKAVNLQVWDTAGQETFRSIGRSYYRGAAAALLVYDVTNRESFNHLSGWVREIHEYGSPETVIILVGNKIDMEDQRDVSTEEGAKFAKENGFIFIETSAKTAENVEDAFIQTARAVFGKIRSGIVDPRSFPGIKFSPSEMENWNFANGPGASGGGNGKGSISLGGADGKGDGKSGGFSCC